ERRALLQTPAPFRQFFSPDFVQCGASASHPRVPLEAPTHEARRRFLEVRSIAMRLSPLGCVVAFAFALTAALGPAVARAQPIDAVSFASIDVSRFSDRKAGYSELE